MCFISHYDFACTSHASLRGRGECVWHKALREGPPTTQKPEGKTRSIHKGIDPKTPALPSQEVQTPKSSLLLWKLPLHPGTQL